VIFLIQDSIEDGNLRITVSYEASSPPRNIRDWHAYGAAEVLIAKAMFKAS
jgi:hypothetical protein